MFEFLTNLFRRRRPMAIKSENYAKDIITGFKQGGMSNCVAIAVIKAGMEVFGTNQLLLLEAQSTGETRVTMRDGFQLHLTAEDILLATQRSLFLRGSNEQLLNYANLCFAAMAKRALLMKHEDVKTYEDALISLNNGENFAAGPEWLGLLPHCKPVDRAEIYTLPGIVCASKNHCFFVTYGWEDNYGTPDKISDKELFLERNKFAKFYRIAPQKQF